MESRQLPPLSQLAKVAFLLFLLLLTPFVSSSFRPSYLYFLFNVLIVALGVEAGLLGAISGHRDHDKKPVITSSTVVATNALHQTAVPATARGDSSVGAANSHAVGVPSPWRPPVEKEKKVDTVVTKIMKCPSRASIFFIGSLDSEGWEREEERRVEEEEELEEWKDELFTKAETFIGNFYKQLKMQREESWKRLHDLYHKAL